VIDYLPLCSEVRSTENPRVIYLLMDVPKSTWISFAFSGPTPYVAFSDSTNSKATVMNFNGTDWEAVGQKGFSDSGAEYLSLAFSGSTPYVAYEDDGSSQKATVMKFNETDWEAVGQKGFSELQATYTSLAFSGSTPYLAFAEIEELIPVAVVVMKYSSENGGGDSPGNDGGGCFIASSAYGLP
jgi:hypothetical protein